MENQFFLGVGGYVVCLDKTSGQELWRSFVKRGQLTNIMLDGERVIVHVGGHLFCLRSSDGALLWENPLKGLGYGHGILVSGAAALSGGLISSQIQAQAAALAASAAVAASAATTAAAASSD